MKSLKKKKEESDTMGPILGGRDYGRALWRCEGPKAEETGLSLKLAW